MLLHTQLIQLISNGLMSAAAWSSGKERASSELEVICPVAFHQTGPSPHFLSSCHSNTQATVIQMNAITNIMVYTFSGIFWTTTGPSGLADFRGNAIPLLDDAFAISRNDFTHG
jgi:hypothetical protein